MDKPRTFRDRLREFWRLVKLGWNPPGPPPLRCYGCGELLRFGEPSHYDEAIVGYRCAPQETGEP